MVSPGGVCFEHLPSLSQGEAMTVCLQILCPVGGEAACTPGAVEVEVQADALQEPAGWRGAAVPRGLHEVLPATPGVGTEHSREE